MENFIEKLYWGDIRPWEKYMGKDHPQRKILSKMNTLEEELLNHLSEEDKELFHQYQEYHNKLQSDSEVERFVEGFQLGVRMMVSAVGG